MTELLLIDKIQIILGSTDILSESGSKLIHRIREKWTEYWEEWSDQVFRKLEELERIDILEHDLEQMDWKISEENAGLYIAQLQVVASETDWASWPLRLKKFVLENILHEVIGQGWEKRILVCGRRDETYAMFFYREENGGETDVTDVLKKTGQLMEKMFHIKLAVYPGTWSGREEIIENMRQLKHRRMNNIHGESGIFEEEFENGRGREKKERIRSCMVRWKLLLEKGRTSMTLWEIEAFLEEKDNMKGLSDMVFFHQEYVKMMLELLEEYHLEADNLFLSSAYSYRKFMEAFWSAERMKEAVKQSVEGLQRIVQKPEEILSDVERAKRMIVEHLEWNLSVGEIAEALYISREHLTRLFKREEGIGMKDFMIREKMAMAKEMLTQTDFPVGVIAVRVGYENFSHFTQIFRQLEGVTPMEYRKKVKST
ncbi:MAG TPA: helix-turn-helix domain-containing protein [Candidatus Eisenbergiella merdavium]|uniref:Helix-turn-helix domain-containing protein n=1 Tax=Candidatus Eisenbergiella merdavium TaxID=2838551 RepID=A0A9D2SPR8_9FIRM|nr:helix-turn-helix domain-containing protein [Candidatus Eisenbergiella merdavium]